MQSAPQKRRRLLFLKVAPSYQNYMIPLFFFV